MFKKIIIASDMSDISDAVIHCLKDFKTIGVEEVILFYACGIRHLKPIAEGIKNSVKPILEKQKKMIEKQGFKTSLVIAPGIPSEELNTLSNQLNVSLIIIGSHGHDVFFHSLLRLGNVTSEILHNHLKPLLVVHTNINIVNGVKNISTNCNSLNENILFPTDFSDISMDAFKYVEKIVEDGCKKVTLFHVQDKVHIEAHLSDKLEEFNNIDNERLQMRKKQLESKGATSVDIKIVFGHPAKEIINESKNGYSLIVMGSQGKGFIKEIFIGSVSYHVVRQSNVSTLLIPNLNR